jgi:hypothetical protein
VRAGHAEGLDILKFYAFIQQSVRDSRTYVREWEHCLSLIKNSQMVDKSRIRIFELIGKNASYTACTDLCFITASVIWIPSVVAVVNIPKA